VLRPALDYRGILQSLAPDTIADPGVRAFLGAYYRP